MTDPPCRCLDLESVRDITIVRLRRREAVDPGSDKYGYTDEVGKALHGLVEVRGCRRILIDLANFETLSHPGELSELMSLWQKARRAGGRLKFLCQPNGYREIFRITRMDQVYEFFDDEQEDMNSAW